jgi:cytochrome c oxidase cbb3-type subunit 4
MMDLYSLMREFADSWALLMLFVVFVGVILWAFRPGSRRVHDDVANIPFRHEDRPAPAEGAPEEART